jgi:putative transposase
MFSKYMPCDPLIFIKDNRVFLSTSFDVPAILIKNDTILGVDLGMRRLVTTSNGDCIKSTEYLSYKRKIRYLKRTFQSKNTKSAKRHLKRLKRKEFNFSKNYIHHLANKILETDKSIIVMEDLTKIKTKKNKYQNLNKKSQIPFYLLRTILTYKAPQNAKQVVTVDPSFTSKDDCRKLQRGERKGCRYYAVDGKILDADWNAAINIANKYSEHPISFNDPLDGKLNLIGRLLSTSQSYSI